ncbi:MAG: phosphatidylglycerophosphatase A [Alphaproteobacteria bacterium]|nr:phosphatidylglycerophosphatase A [Alphaproteobacteria bacterium]
MNNLSKLYKFICYTICSVFGVGFCPKASGTAGSLVTIPAVAFIVYHYGWLGIVIFATITFLLGTLASVEVLKYTEHDPSLIVIDEVVGQTLAFLLIGNKLQGNLEHWWLYLVGFGLFRLFDIKKMGLVKYFDEKVLNAWGVMTDDVFAGLYATIIMYFIVLFI